MKRIVFLLLILAAVQYRAELYQLVNPPEDYTAAHGGKVVLYATDWCGYCAKARKLMKNNGIEYYEYDIEKSVEGNRQYKELGGNGVPVLVIGNEVVHGYDPQLILELAGG